MEPRSQHPGDELSDPVSLPPEAWQRYARQIGPGVLSREAQRRLSRATVLITRAGGMGGPTALALAAAGVGRIVLAHGGLLQLPDLNRQILGSEAGLGQPRAAQFAARLRSLNSAVDVVAIDHEPDEAEAHRLAQQADLIISAAPNFAERFRLNFAAVTTGKPLIDAAQWGMQGSLCVLAPGKTACLRCLYPEPPEFEEHFPVLGAISMAIGALAALEAIKILAQVGEPSWGKMWIVDAYRGHTSIVELVRSPDCRACGKSLPAEPTPESDR